MSEPCKITLPTGQGFLCITHNHWTSEPGTCLVGSLLSELEELRLRARKARALHVPTTVTITDREGEEECEVCNECGVFLEVEYDGKCPTIRALNGGDDGQDDQRTLPLHRTEAGWPNCSTCDGGGCYDCTESAYRL
jgi:hypothetical protein